MLDTFCKSICEHLNLASVVLFCKLQLQISLYQLNCVVEHLATGFAFCHLKVAHKIPQHRVQNYFQKIDHLHQTLVYWRTCFPF